MAHASETVIIDPGEIEREILYRAATAAVGLVLITSDPEAAASRLTRRRTQMADPLLSGLQFRRLEFGGGNLVITKSAKFTASELGL